MRTLIALAALLVALTSCAQPTRNDTDVMFLQMLIPHARQGAEIAAIAETRDVRPETRALAGAVKLTQRDEAAAMTARLTTWEEPLTAPPGSHDSHGGAHETRPSDIAELRAVTGPEFETRFLDLLIGHQHNAVDLARMEIRSGLDADTIALARRVEASRTAQIQQMLKSLG